MSKRPIIGCDIDGVICDLNRLVLDRLRVDYVLDYAMADITAWEYPDCLPGVTNEMFHACLDAIFAEQHDESHCIAGAGESLNRIAKIADVVLISARRSCVYDHTGEWLRRIGLKYKTLYCGVRRKYEEFSHIDVMIEDNGATALSFAEHGRPVVLFDYAYNRDVSHELIKRVKDWDGAVNVVEGIVVALLKPGETLDSRQQVR